MIKVCRLISFLALKISYINDIANLCEKVGANIDDVVKGMKFDIRIGDKFFNAGIGYMVVLVSQRIQKLFIT